MKNSGFTLIELMVVILIIGMIATFSLPSLTRNVPRYRLNNDGENIRGQLMIARTKAIAEGYQYLGVFTKDATSFNIVKDINSNNAYDSGEPTTIIKLSSGIKIKSNTQTISFNTRGYANVGGTIELVNEKSEISKVYVTLSGMIVKS